MAQLNFIYITLWNVLAACFVAIELVVLAWFLRRQRHIMQRQLQVITISPRETSEI